MIPWWIKCNAKKRKKFWPRNSSSRQVLYILHFHQIEGVEFICNNHGQTFHPVHRTVRRKGSEAWNYEAVCTDRGVFVSSGNEKIASGERYVRIEFEWDLAVGAVVILIYRGLFAPLFLLPPFSERRAVQTTWNNKATGPRRAVLNVTNQLNNERRPWPWKRFDLKCRLQRCRNNFLLRLST